MSKCGRKGHVIENEDSIDHPNDVFNDGSLDKRKSLLTYDSDYIIVDNAGLD